MATADLGARVGARGGAARRFGDAVRARPRTDLGAAAGGARAVRPQVAERASGQRWVYARRRRRRRRGSGQERRRTGQLAHRAGDDRGEAVRARRRLSRPVARAERAPHHTGAAAHGRRARPRADAVDPGPPADAGQGQVPRRPAGGAGDHRSRRPDHRARPSPRWSTAAATSLRRRWGFWRIGCTSPSRCSRTGPIDRSSRAPRWCGSPISSMSPGRRSCPTRPRPSATTAR